MMQSILGYSAWSGWTFLGRFDILDAYDWFANSLLLPVGALLTTLFTGYVWKVRTARTEANRGAGRLRVGVGWGLLVRYIIPAVLALIIGVGLIDTFW